MRKQPNQRTTAPKVAFKSAFINRPLSVYVSGGATFLSLNQISRIIGIKKGGPSLVQYVGQENCIESVSKGTRIYYGKSDNVLAYLKRSRKKPATNLYVALLALLKEQADNTKGTKETERQTPPVALLARLDDRVGNDALCGWESGAAKKFADQQGARYPNAAIKPEKEVPGFYFDLSAFFDLTIFDMAWIKDNRGLFSREIREAVHTMLEVGEPLRGEQRVAFTSVISRLASYQSVLNSIC